MYGLRTEHLVVRTFFSVLSVSRTFDLHTHMRVAQDFTGVVLFLCAPQKSSTHSMFHRPHFGVPDPFPSYCSTPPPSTSAALPMNGIRRPSCATRPGRLLFVHLAESTPLTGYEPKSCIDVSSEHYADQLPIEEKQLQHRAQRPYHQSRRPPKTLMVFQAAASGSAQEASSSVVNPWLSVEIAQSQRFSEAEPEMDIGNTEMPISPFTSSTDNSNLMENKKWETDSSKKVAQEIAKKLRNYEESVTKKQIEPNNCELMNLSLQQERNPSTVSQLLTQIQDLAEQGEFLPEMSDLGNASWKIPGLKAGTSTS